MSNDDEARFTDMYRNHYADVLRFVSRRAHPTHVDDIVGETFLTAWRRRDGLPADPRPWLFTTARNVMLNTRRGSRRQADLAVHIRVSLGDAGHDPTADADRRMDVAVAWQGLTAADQEALALHLWEGLTAGDAAAVLGCSRAAYAMRLTRSKRRFARLLAPAGVLTPVFSTK